MSQILKSVDFTKEQKSRYLENKILFFVQIRRVGITKPCTRLLHPAHFNLQLALCNTLNVIRTKTLHVIGQFLPKLGWKIQRCPFWLKIGTHGLLVVLILNLHLDFWNSDPKIHFRANLGSKSQSCLFCLKIGTHYISRMLILIPALVFWISNPKSIFGQIWPKKVKNVRFAWKLAHIISRGRWFLFRQ